MCNVRDTAHTFIALYSYYFNLIIERKCRCVNLIGCTFLMLKFTEQSWNSLHRFSERAPNGSWCCCLSEVGIIAGALDDSSWFRSTLLFGNQCCWFFVLHPGDAPPAPPQKTGFHCWQFMSFEPPAAAAGASARGNASAALVPTSWCCCCFRLNCPILVPITRASVCEQVEVQPFINLTHFINRSQPGDQSIWAACASASQEGRRVSCCSHTNVHTPQCPGRPVAGLKPWSAQTWSQLLLGSDACLALFLPRFSLNRLSRVLQETKLLLLSWSFIFSDFSSHRRKVSWR